MPTTVYPSSALQLGYQVDTTVVMTKPQLTGAGEIMGVAVGSAGTGYTAGDVCSVDGGAGGQVSVASVDGSGAVTAVSIATPGTGYTVGGHSTAGGSGSGFSVNVTSVSPGTQIGTMVYPAAITGISASMLLQIAGAEFTVASMGSDTDGDHFVIPTATIANGAVIRTPWDSSGPLLYTRASLNTATLTYTATGDDLYLRTQMSSDSGSVDVTFDDVSLGTFSLSHSTTILAEVLLKAGGAAGRHTVKITANISGGAIFIYLGSFSIVEHAPETGGAYDYDGPTGALEDSNNNFIGDWSMDSGDAYNSNGAGSVFFYPQLAAGGKVTIRVQKTPNSCIIGVGVNGSYPTQYIDLYADPAVASVEITILDTATGDSPGNYAIELRNTGTKNSSSSGLFFYFKSSAVYVVRSDTAALTLIADYLKHVAAIRGDGSFVDAFDSQRINFDANAWYGCMGLLAASVALSDASYLTPVKNFLTWFAGMQLSNPGVAFDDGSWKIGYQVNPSGPPTYIPAIAPYDAEGIDEIRWVDTVQILGCFVLWWYWKLSGDDATLASLLPTYRKGVDGVLLNNYDGGTSFLYSSWQHFTATGWQLLKSRFAADQSDDILGLIALWLMTRSAKYAQVAARLLRRFGSKFWNGTNWNISVDGDAPGTPSTGLYPQTTGYTVFAQKQSRFSAQTSASLLAGLTAIETYATAEGGFLVPLYQEAERIFSAFYVLGQNQYAVPSNSSLHALAKQYIKDGQYLQTLGGQQVGGVQFSKRYATYLYSNISGFAAMALAGTRNPFTEQLKFSESRMVMKQ